MQGQIVADILYFLCSCLLGDNFPFGTVSVLSGVSTGSPNATHSQGEIRKWCNSKFETYLNIMRCVCVCAHACARLIMYFSNMNTEGDKVMVHVALPKSWSCPSHASECLFSQLCHSVDGHYSLFTLEFRISSSVLVHANMLGVLGHS